MSHELEVARVRQKERRAARCLRVAGVLLLAGLMAGCGMASSKPHGPAVAVPETWQGSGPTTVSSTPQDLSRWWERLGDATLSDLITTALTASPELRGAQSRLREARARRGLARTDLYPTVDASVSRQITKTSDDGAKGTTQNRYRAGFDASWEPDIFGATSRAVSAAQADLEASEADLRATQVSLAAEVALNYVELRAFQAKRAIASENLDRQSQTLELTQWRAVAGLTSELDVEQARANLEQTRARIPSLESSVAEAEHRLAILLGQPPAALHDLLATPSQVPAAPAQVTARFPAETLRQRPDVRAAERRLAAATARLGEAEAARYPSLKLSGSLGIEGLIGTDTLVRSLVGSLSAPIFNRARIRQQIDIKSESQEQALIAYEKTILAALEEVENALVELANAERRRTALAAAVDAARDAAQLARDRYVAGLTSYQTVLDTEHSVLSAEDSLTAITAEGTSALIRLYKALGGGWERAEGKQSRRVES